MPSLEKHQSKVKIILADDHFMLRQGIRTLIDREPNFEVVAEANDGHESITLTDEYNPDIVLMDVAMPKVGGLEATRQIKAAHPHTAVIVLTIYDDEEYIIGFLEAGAAGYLMKSAYGDELIQAIKSVLAGDLVLHPAIGQKLLKCCTSRYPRPARSENMDKLTPREIEVLKLLVRGMNNHNISLELGLSIRTVKGHLASIFSKMKVKSRNEAVLHALKRGLVSLDEVI